jgi:hypothetical protein
MSFQLDLEDVIAEMQELHGRSGECGTAQARRIALILTHVSEMVAPLGFQVQVTAPAYFR